MKIILSIIIYFVLTFTIFSQTNPNHVWVNGYTKRDGTHVDGYYRTAPNHTNVDNFSTVGNTNPYTGQLGYIKSDGQKNPWSDEQKQIEDITYDIEPYISTYTTSSSTNKQANSNNTISNGSLNNEKWYSKGDQVNVRFEPNKSSKIAFRIDKGDEVEVLNRSDFTQFVDGYGQDFWYEIRYNNLTGWVFGKLIGFPNYTTSTLNDWNGEYLTISSNSVNVRTDPSTKDGQIKFKLNKGIQVEILAKTTNKHFVKGYGDDYWYYIKIDDRVGWVFGKLTS